MTPRTRKLSIAAAVLIVICVGLAVLMSSGGDLPRIHGKFLRFADNKTMAVVQITNCSSSKVMVIYDSGTEKCGFIGQREVQELQIDFDGADIGFVAVSYIRYRSPYPFRAQVWSLLTCLGYDPVPRWCELRIPIDELLMEEELKKRNPLFKALAEGRIPDYKTATRQFLERLKTNASPIDLQQWAVKVIEDTGEGSRPIDLFEDQLPAFVVNLDPPLKPTATILPGSHVMLDWGGGWGHWGVLVGNSTFRPSNDEDVGVFVIEWLPGIHVYGTK